MKRTAEQEKEYNRLLQRVTIYKAQVRAFEFMSGMAKDLDDAVRSLGAYINDSLMCALTQLELLQSQNFYYTVANEIGRCWLEEK